MPLYNPNIGIAKDGTTTTTARIPFAQNLSLGTGTGLTNVNSGASASAKTVTLPNTTTTLAGLGTIQTFTALNTFIGGVNINTGKLTLMDQNMTLGVGTGTKFGTATTEKLAFHNATPVVQRSGAAQAAVVTTGSTNVVPFGFTTAGQADAIVTLVNEMRAWAVEKGFIKGSA